MQEKNISQFELAFQTFTFICLILTISFASCIFCSCTVSFQNISTHGTATDVVDDTLSNDVQTNPTISADLPLPKVKMRPTAPKE